ncbi:MAG: FAD-dependent oxidoreductase, partial [Proteiniphilum sp.]|nr:FAD-dependent oxidoreductase [Proteiniphilum sp.]
MEKRTFILFMIFGGLLSFSGMKAEKYIPPHHPAIHYSGRVDRSNQDTVRFDWHPSCKGQPQMAAPGSTHIQSPDVLIVGGGTSGVSAGISSARMGAQTMIIEESDWLGGMLTSAGVSAIDGNYNLPSGFWGEFKDSLTSYYG